MTTGIVNALGRAITAPGVDAQIHSESGANSGVGFAIPADTVEAAVGRSSARRTATRRRDARWTHGASLLIRA